MSSDPRVLAVWFVLEKLRRRLRAARGADPDAGALSLEWVAIAIVLVVAALALTVFLDGKLTTLESHVPSNPSAPSGS